MELRSEPGAVSGLVGLRVRDPGGRSLGRVYELRACWRGDRLVVEELLVGRRALVRRLRGPGPEPRAIPWEAIARIDGGEVVVHEAPG